MSEQEPVKEGKEEYFIQRLACSFNIRNSIQYDKFKKSFESEDNKYWYLFTIHRLVFDRLMKDENNMMAIFAIQSAAEAVTLYIEVPHPDKFRKKGLVALKIIENQLTPGNIVQGLVFVELTRNVFYSSNYKNRYSNICTSHITK